MAPPGIPRRALNQDNVFFSSEWSRAMDRQFISIFLQLKNDSFWRVGKKNERASTREIGMYNVIYGTNFDMNFGLERVRKLQKHFKVFTWVIQRPWETYDPITHSVTCQDTVWKVLYDQKMLVAPYIHEGEHSYAELTDLFKLEEDIQPPQDDVIEISSDRPNSSVVEIPNPYDSCLSSTHFLAHSSLNSDGLFYNELSWNYSDSDSGVSAMSPNQSTGASVNCLIKGGTSRINHGRLGGTNAEDRKGQSSCASWSPFKKR